MPVPMSVMQAAAQGDKKAMRLVEQEYGVGDGRRYAENWLTEEEPPPSKIKIQTTDLLKKHQDVPFVDRILRPNLYPVRQNEDGSTSTHLMGYGEADGRYFAYPALQLIDGGWVEDEDPTTALERENIIWFDKEAKAKQFAAGSWK